MLWQTSAARPPPDGARVLPRPRSPLNIDKNNYARVVLFCFPQGASPAIAHALPLLYPWQRRRADGLQEVFVSM